ncbi:helix-turn-helix protein [compost metagenome]
MKIGAFLKACRERANISQDEMSDTLHMTQSAISRIESNRQSADFDTVVKWVDACDMRALTVAYVWGFKEVENMIYLNQNLQEVRNHA